MEINEDILLEHEPPVEPGLWQCTFRQTHVAGQQCDCDHE